MNQSPTHECTNCGEQLTWERRNYRYAECGLPNVVLQGVNIADCPKCGNSDVSLPRLANIHRAIARALLKSPGRLTGPQLRFLRKHLGWSGDDLGSYLHTDKTKISKWETGEDSIGPVSDRLIRLLVTASDEELRPQIVAVAGHLRQIADKPGHQWELHVDVETLQATYFTASEAA
jgi:putative zinc finger/helix-turn-helix YgiT family protein